MTDAIGSTTSAGAIGASAPDAMPSLTPEALLAYCESRLGTIDGVIDQRFAEQKSRNEAVKSYGQLSDVLARNGSGQTKGGTGCEWFQQQQGADLRTLYNDTSDPRARDAIADTYRTVTGDALAVQPDGKVAALDWHDVKLNPDGIQPFSADEWAKKKDVLKTTQDALSKDNEMSMIELQSMISQRQLAVQLTTQMMSAMNEGQKGIIANIRA